MCVQFLSLRIVQWRNEAVKVDIQRHRLNIREKDVQLNIEESLEERLWGANGESELTKLRNPIIFRMAWCYQNYDKPVIM